MINDALVAFQPIGSPLSLVGATGSTFASALTYDFLGQGVGQPPGNIIGNRTLAGTDEGVGGKRPELNVVIGTAVVAVGACVLKAALQAAVDTGVGGGYLPGTWTDVDSQDNIAAVNLVAGAVIFRSPWIPQMPANLQARYLRLLFTLSGGTSFTAGTIGSATVTMVRDDQANKYASKNFSVA